MTQENKELLLKDLCARLQYGVKVNVTYSNENASSFRQRVCTEGVNVLNTDIIGLYQRNEIDIKPYLFQLSSMTEKQKEELMELMYKADTPFGAIFSENIDYFDWLNKHHFDYRGLIEKGLAIDATGLNIY